MGLLIERCKIGRAGDVAANGAAEVVNVQRHAVFGDRRAEDGDGLRRGDGGLEGRGRIREDQVDIRGREARADRAAGGDVVGGVLLFKNDLVTQRLGQRILEALRRGIEKATEVIVKELVAAAKDVETKDQIAATATISAADPEVGEKIAEALDKVGQDGVVTVEDNNRFGLDLDFTEGMRFDKGYIAPYFVTNADDQTAVLEDPYILLTSGKVSSQQDIVHVAELVMKTGKPLLIIAEDVDGEALPTLILNNIRGTFKSCAVKAPGFGDRRKAMLQDMAILTGAQVVSDELGLKLESVDTSVLGHAKKVIVSKDETTIVQGAGSKEDIDARVAQIRAELENTDSDYDREKLQERLAKLAGGVAVIKVGAATEVEAKERKHRIEDAVRNAKAAIEEGLLPGGGVALVQAAAKAEKTEAVTSLTGEEATGAAIVFRAIEAPIKQIAENAGVSGDVVINTVRSLPDGEGFNAATDTYEDLLAAGVTDPVKVTRSALQNAASIAGLFLTTEAVVANKPEPKSAAPAAGADMGY